MGNLLFFYADLVVSSCHACAFVPAPAPAEAKAATLFGAAGHQGKQPSGADVEKDPATLPVSDPETSWMAS
jgi:hypothetical protein